MSAFAGVYHSDGRPADRELITAMGQAIARKGPDGGIDWCAGSLGMSYRAFHTTHESHFERQPMVGARGVMLCWDGRLDNREELQEWLGSEAPLTDAGLALAAYGRWGEEFAGRLVGDFALALYDPNERQVLLARDFFGPRPLYYLERGETLMWSTDLLPLVEHGEVDLALDEHYIAQFLVQSIETHRTPYVKIRAVEPGHVMVFREGRLRKNEWHWKPDPKKEIRYRADGEYEEHFYQLFRESVKARLRSDGRPVWADLSGGLDSSSIVCMADDILAKEGAECPRVDTWTAVNGESILTNELPYVKLVEGKRGREGFHLREDELWFKGILEIKEPVLIPQALLCIPERFRMLQEQMDAAGARVRLNGHGGDHLLWKLSEPSVEIADALRGGRVFELHRLVRVWSAAMRIPYVQVLFKYGIAKLLPEPVARSFRPERMGLRFLRDRRVAARYRKEPPFPPDRFGCRSVRGRMQSSVLLASIRFVASEPMPSSLRAEVRYPFLSRPLAEYLFAVPHSQKQRPHESRSLMRRAFRELLPHGIGLRETKGTVDEAVCRGLNAALEEVEFLMSSRLSARAGLDYEALSDAMRDVIHGGTTNRGDALRLIALGLFTANAGHKVQPTVSSALSGAAFRISAPIHGGTPREAPMVGTEKPSY